MTSSESGKFTCNICGAVCERPAGSMGRETENCPECKSTLRLRALIALLSQEIFGLPLSLPEFPALKGIRGMGMSDSPELAALLAEKFDYTNTFYHQPPVFDVTRPDERDLARYDFIVSSEVMEHVPPPVENAFATLCRMLRPDGLLLLTAPYTLEGRTVEHFPELHQYTLAAPGGRTVLVNRRRDGQIEVFENLVFHGGHGSTLEMRVFTEGSLRAMLAEAGFASVYIATENWPDFGVEHAETWSLPLAARKGNFRPPSAELARGYRDACRRAMNAERSLVALRADYERHVAHHTFSHQELTQRVQDLDRERKRALADVEEQTKWALDLDRERNRAIAEFERVKSSETEAWQCVDSLGKQLAEAKKECARLESRLWTRLGRKLRALD